ncbi:MAG: ester cyclase [Thaumarchaeota archaeon]|nr:ester cyclase [Nitrososphaerota archaeon]
MLLSTAPLPDQPPGIKGLKSGLKLFKKGFPDLTMKVNDLIAEGDKVAARVTYTGTHKGKFMGLKPTNKKFNIMGTDFVRFGKDGRAKEHWSGDDAYLKMM